MLLPARVPSPFVVALVATRDRPALLPRALASIAAQTRPPNAVVLVEDGPEISAASRRIAAECGLPASVDLIYLKNRRTPGAAGAWSSGIDEAARRFAPASSLYIAILDDDDWWDPAHLACCLGHAVAHDVDVVATGIIRYEGDELAEGRTQEPPASLAADEALVRNPHIQGSNLFVRLSTLLEAGMFDESLRSTTDRDLVVRLADLGATYAAIGRATVHHDARGARPRLSTAGSEAKSEGLARFWSKYRLRMSEAARAAFQERARTVFSTDVAAVAVRPPIASAREPSGPGRPAPGAPSGESLVLVVGVTCDGDERGVARVAPLLGDLLALGDDERVAALDVVVVENGSGGEALRAAIDEWIGRGLRCYLADVARQRADAAAGLFGPGFVRRAGRIGISEARAITQRYVRRLMRPGSVAWILDDDKRLAPLVREGGGLARRAYDVVGAIGRLRASGADIVLGTDTGAAPLPAAATLRTQLVDLGANLAAMRALGPAADWPDRMAENLAHARAAPDFYYDLSRQHTWHLELPFWLPSDPRDGSVRAAFARLCARAPRILAGEQVFRPLVTDDPAELTLRPSIRRGGSTLVFTADALVDVPQVVPAPDGRPTRRSDMVWALLSSRLRGRRVEEASFTVFHDRSDIGNGEPEVALDVLALIDDIRGYALYSTLRDVMERWPALDGPSEDAALFARDRYQKYLVERGAALALSVHRARGAARVVRAIATDPAAWWHAEPGAQEDAARLAAFAEHVLASLEPHLVERLRAAIADTPPLAIAEYMGALRAKLDAAAVPVTVKPVWIREERVRIAQAQIERLARPAAALTLLGAGYEGVVFTDGREVFKYLDLWRARAPDAERAFLRGQIGAWTDTLALYPLCRLLERGPDAILVYTYEPSEPFVGGHAEGIVRLLRECRAHGVVCRNLHPRNLRVVGDRVRLVDYGVDLVPLDAAGWRAMVRRAWLCWRWPHHPELEAVMTRALREEVPELSGWEALERAALAGDAKRDLDELVRAAVLRAAPSKVLDYGCGGGGLVRDLAARGITAVGYDPHPSHNWQDGEVARFTADRVAALAGGPYDVVACSLVLCAIEDEGEYRAVLAGLRAAVRAGGRAIVAVCNPLHTLGGDTPLQIRSVPDGSDADRRFVWTKTLRATGRRRRDVHRPLHILRRDLLRVGLVVEDIGETETVASARLEPASDFMVLTARAVDAGQRVSLLVRASALEWRTLAVQIRHVVEQLEGPSAFHERIVVLDSRRAGFVRQYDEADLEAARLALGELVVDGTIDRVVEASADAGALAAASLRWFSLPATGTHTESGAPIAATLAGLEVCSGDYILHVDDDLLVARLDRAHDYLCELAGALEREPEAVCASLSICGGRDRAWTAGDARGPWRVETRGTLLHRARLLASRPWPNELRGQVLARSWHRALDERIRTAGLRSLRGGHAATFFIHPPNERKRQREEWLAILDRVEAGAVPGVQVGDVDLRGDLGAWLAPRRAERIVVIACGRDVSASRVARFRDALIAQTEQGWGLVVVEDGGARTSAEVVRRVFGTWPNATVLALRERRGGLANIVWALRYVCKDPRSIIVLVDLDDALLGAGALARVARELELGADLIVGGMLRTDKGGGYPVDFERPRERRGGNVWQHLRAFRRELFDLVPDDELRLDGAYVDLAWDWALMLPLVEVARAPRFIAEPLYLHEPSGVGKAGEARRAREAIIGRIVARPALRSRGRS
ncbi:MAG TPA: glycosyltransferase [Kofleriaceae bacterium]|nr:glycosyltransferase [Kofleriaceae bacterium]